MIASGIPLLSHVCLHRPVGGGRVIPAFQEHGQIHQCESQFQLRSVSSASTFLISWHRQYKLRVCGWQLQLLLNSRELWRHDRLIRVGCGHWGTSWSRENLEAVQEKKYLRRFPSLCSETLLYTPPVPTLSPPGHWQLTMDPHLGEVSLQGPAWTCTCDF